MNGNTRKIGSQRHLFDIPEEIGYFNCAYYSPLLNESAKRLHEGVNTKCHPWERVPANFFDDAEIIRQLASDIFGGDADGFAIVPSASYGVSTAARALEPQLQKGDRILVLEQEFPSVVLPLKRVAEETGGELITVRTPETGNWTQAIKEKLDNTIKVVAISACHWTNGAYINLAEIRQACNEIDSILIIDGSQSLGAIPFSIDDIKPDFLVAAGYKWLFCPYGFSLLYVAEKWRSARPLEETWIARENAEDFAGLIKYSEAYMPGSRRFDVGEKCTPTILPGAIAALQQIKQWGVKNISDSLLTINNAISNHLEDLNFKVPDEKQRYPHMFGAEIPLKYEGNLVNELRNRNIYISQRGKSVRISPHLHINEMDVSRFLNTLTDLINK
jgi:selenocysteine lyase/cysteine desulfurase